MPLISAAFGWAWTCISHRQGLPWKSRMFRIHRSENGEVVLTISGRLDAEHVAELETLIPAERRGRRIFLARKILTLRGREGIDFLTRWEAAVISRWTWDPYVRE